MRLFQKYAPVLLLLILAPWVGEYLLGNVPAGLLWAFPFLIPLYGGGALLIRETARRVARGYFPILLLGAAYGVVEAGLFDQSLFNLAFEGHDYRSTTTISFLGVSAYHAMTFIVGHAVWSITIPIAIAEMLTPSRKTEPWLGRTGLIVAIVLYLLGGWIIFQDMQQREAFLASPMQRIGAGSCALLLIIIALASKKKTIAPSNRPVPRPLPLGVGTFILACTYQFRPENWTGVVMGLFMLLVSASLLIYWSAQMKWSVWHQFALVAGALPVYALNGFILTYLLRPDDTTAWIGNVAFAALAILLLWLVAKTTRRHYAPDTGSQ